MLQTRLAPTAAPTPLPVPVNLVGGEGRHRGQEVAIGEGPTEQPSAEELHRLGPAGPARADGIPEQLI